MRINRRILLRFGALAGFSLLAGCASHTGQKEEAITPGPQRVGTVAVVNEELHFVLIDVGSLYSPAPGTALKSFSGAAETAILAVDAEKQRPFIVADIVKGNPKVGDQVEE